MSLPRATAVILRSTTLLLARKRAPLGLRFRLGVCLPLNACLLLSAETTTWEMELLATRTCTTGRFPTTRRLVAFCAFATTLRRVMVPTRSRFGRLPLPTTDRTRQFSRTPTFPSWDCSTVLPSTRTSLAARFRIARTFLKSALVPTVSEVQAAFTTST